MEVAQIGMEESEALEQFEGPGEIYVRKSESL